MDKKELKETKIKNEIKIAFDEALSFPPQTPERRLALEHWVNLRREFWSFKRSVQN